MFHSKTFWKDSFWLPQNITWTDLKARPDITFYPEFNHLFWPVSYIIVVILMVRFLLERFVFLPFGRRMGLEESSNKKSVATKNILLFEKALIEQGLFKRKLLHNNEIKNVAKQLDWSERKVERWIRFRKHLNQPSTLTKLQESCWRLIYTLSVVILGFFALWDKAWFWNWSECWTNYPYQIVSWDVQIYFLVQLGGYCSMLLSIFTDVKRKDFREMFVHHLITISLSLLAFTTNCIRASSVLLILHDCSDIFLEASKIFNYIKWRNSCNVCFGVFTVVWTLTRLIIYPWHVLINYMFNAPKAPFAVAGLPPIFTVLYSLFVLLFCVHLFWTYYILKIFGQILSSKMPEKDPRSESSSSE